MTFNKNEIDRTDALDAIQDFPGFLYKNDVFLRRGRPRNGCEGVS